MRYPRDQTDAKHVGTSPGGVRTPASVDHIRIPGHVRPVHPRYSIPLSGHTFLGQRPGHTGGSA